MKEKNKKQDLKRLEELVTWFQYQIELDRNKENGINFIRMLAGDLGMIQSEILKQERKLQEIDKKSENTGNFKEFHQAYLTGMTAAFELINQEYKNGQNYSQVLDVKILNLTTQYNARWNAFQFVLEQGFDTKKIESEIEEISRITFFPPDHLKGPMHPKAGPGIYNRYYIKSLVEAIELIKTG